MNNLETLYREDGAFRVDAIKHAANFIGTTSLEFAEEWLTNESGSIGVPTDPGEAAIVGVNAFIAEHEPDSYGNLEADIDSWLGKWPGLSVRVADIKEKIMGWIDRACRIREHDLGHVRESWAKRIDDQSCEIAALKAERDNLAADLKDCMELNDKLSDEREKWRGTCGLMVDAAHEIERILAEMEAK